MPPLHTPEIHMCKFSMQFEMFHHRSQSHIAHANAEARVAASSRPSLSLAWSTWTWTCTSGRIRCPTPIRWPCRCALQAARHHVPTTKPENMQAAKHCTSHTSCSKQHASISAYVHGYVLFPKECALFQTNVPPRQKKDVMV